MENNLLLKEWNFEKNAKLPEKYTIGSSYRAHWICSVNNSHIWQTRIFNRTKNNPTGCPDCSISGIKPTPEYNLQICFPEIAKEWSCKNEKLASEVLPKSTIFVWWKCLNDNSHKDWKSPIRVHVNGCSKCPDCQADFVTKHPEIAKQWNYEKNKKPPEDYSFGSPEKVWWICEGRRHEWEASINSRTSRNNGCPYCSNKMVCSDNNLTITHSYILNEWDFSKNDKSPTEFTFGSNVIVNWVCLKNSEHKWPAAIGDRIGKKSACPYCVKIVSDMENDWFTYINDDNIKKQYPIVINNKRFIVDGFNKLTNTVFEFNGDFWHGNPVIYNLNDFNKKINKSYGELYNKTIEKENILKNGGYNLVVMWEYDWKMLQKSKKVA